jgi:hypothetical protein
MRRATVRAAVPRQPIAREDALFARLTGPRRLTRQRRRQIRTDQATRAAQARFRPGLLAYVRGGDLPTFLTAPLIYSVLVPFLVLDAWITAYQWVCFPVYGIARVPRRRYFALDRHELAYLNALEKVNCTFCSYCNGVVAYVREVAARTEQYWCAIKHARRIPAPHPRYDRFAEYGDARAYRIAQPTLRLRLPRPAEPRRGRRSR